MLTANGQVPHDEACRLILPRKSTVFEFGRLPTVGGVLYVVGGSEKKERGTQRPHNRVRCLSQPRARGQLEPSHAHCANWRLNGEHKNAHTIDLDHVRDDDPTRKRADQNLQNLKKGLSDQEVYRLLASVLSVGTIPWQ